MAVSVNSLFRYYFNSVLILLSSNPAGLTRLLPLAPKVVVQPKETWACPQCTLINQPDAQYCEVCDGEKPDEEILRALRESEQPAQPTSQQEPEEVPQETSLAPKWKDLYRERRAAGTFPNINNNWRNLTIHPQKSMIRLLLCWIGPLCIM